MTCTECKGEIIKTVSDYVCINCGLVQNSIIEDKISSVEYYSNNSNRKKTHHYQFKQYFDFYIRCLTDMADVEIPSHIINFLRQQEISNFKQLTYWLIFLKLDRYKRHSKLIWRIIKNERIEIPNDFVLHLKGLYMRFIEIYPDYRLNKKKNIPISIILRFFTIKLNEHDFLYNNIRPIQFIRFFKYNCVSKNRERNLKILKTIVEKYDFIINNIRIN